LKRGKSPCISGPVLETTALPAADPKDDVFAVQVTSATVAAPMGPRVEAVYSPLSLPKWIRVQPTAATNNVTLSIYSPCETFKGRVQFRWKMRLRVPPIERVFSLAGKHRQLDKKIGYEMAFSFWRSAHIWRVPFDPEGTWEPLQDIRNIQAQPEAATVEARIAAENLSVSAPHHARTTSTTQYLTLVRLAAYFEQRLPFLNMPCAAVPATHMLSDPQGLQHKSGHQMEKNIPHLQSSGRILYLPYLQAQGI
jgi:hypothetical protein